MKKTILLFLMLYSMQILSSCARLSTSSNDNYGSFDPAEMKADEKMLKDIDILCNKRAYAQERKVLALKYDDPSAAQKADEEIAQLQQEYDESQNELTSLLTQANNAIVKERDKLNLLLDQFKSTPVYKFGATIAQGYSFAEKTFGRIICFISLGLNGMQQIGVV